MLYESDGFSVKQDRVGITVNPRYNDRICSQDIAIILKLLFKESIMDIMICKNALFYSYFHTEHMFWIFVRITSLRRL